MNTLEIILLALALSADAFAVSISIGLGAKKVDRRTALTVGAAFGIFQGAMPVAGFFAAYFFVGFVVGFGYIIAAALLAFVGAKMIFDSLKKSEPHESRENVYVGIRQLLILAVATSVDALAVGISFAFVDVTLPLAVVTIGLVTFCISCMGVLLGSLLGARFRTKAVFVGGSVLVAIGVWILVQGLWA